MSRNEKKEVKAEVHEIQKELKTTDHGRGVYISVGGLIIIILLLIIIF